MPGKGYIPYEPWPFQAEFLNCRDQLRAINKPRQCGISTTEAVDVAWEFDNLPGAQILIISKDKEAAINFHTYVVNILQSVRQNNPDAPRLIKTNQRETTNSLGNRIISLASSKEAGRSFSATHLVLDELAFIEYAEEIWQAANAAMSQTNGRVTGISTPKGRANLFYRIFEDPGHMGFTTFSYAWWDVPTYNPFYAEYMAAKKIGDRSAVERHIAAARQGEWYLKNRQKYTDLAWRQEFEGAFDANIGSVFSTRQLNKVFERNYLREAIDELGIVNEWYTSDRQSNGLYACGIDLGRKNDPTVIVTYDYHNKPAEIVDYKLIEAGRCDWELIERTILAHLDYWKPIARHDGTGVGDALTQKLEGRSEAFMFTKTGKQNIVERMQHAMDFSAIRMPRIDRLFREHQRYIWDDKDITQDTVMANALAISTFYDTSGGLNGMLDFNLVGRL